MQIIVTFAIKHVNKQSSKALFTAEINMTWTSFQFFCVSVHLTIIPRKFKQSDRATFKCQNLPLFIPLSVSAHTNSLVPIAIQYSVQSLEFIHNKTPRPSVAHPLPHLATAIASSNTRLIQQNPVPLNTSSSLHHKSKKS